MRFLTACLLALLLSWPAWAQEKMTLEAECYESEMVRAAIKDGAIAPLGVGVNTDQEMVVVFAVRGGGYWIALLKTDGHTVYSLSAGPQWEMMPMGQAS